jgi:hypothetical protein
MKLLPLLFCFFFFFFLSLRRAHDTDAEWRTETETERQTLEKERQRNAGSSQVWWPQHAAANFVFCSPRNLLRICYARRQRLR